MNDFEITILDFLQRTFSSPFLDTLMTAVTKFGDNGAIWIALSAVFISIKQNRKAGLSMALALIIGLVVGNLFLKNIVARVRPYDINTEFVLLIDRLSDYSFPSGHTLASFEASVALFIRNKRAGAAALVLAILIAISRLYLYVHYPTDVLASVILGIGIAYLSSFIVDKLYDLYNKKTK